MTFRKFLMIVALLALGCSGHGRVGAAEENAGPKSLLSRFAEISKVQSIEIQDNWMGLSELGPLGKRYLLKPEEGPFNGKAIFSVGGGPNVTTRELTISVPKESIQEFLRLLSESPLEKGTYHPSLTHTDDYPSQKIDIIRADAKLSFYSESQGDTAVPWGATFGGENYTVNSKNPADALAKIRPYLKDADFQKFTEEMRSSLHKKQK